MAKRGQIITNEFSFSVKIKPLPSILVFVFSDIFGSKHMKIKA